MSDAWGGFANGKIPLTAMVKVQNAYFKPDCGNAIAAAIAECLLKDGVSVHINEGYRPLGVPADANIRANGNGDPVSKTSTGGSNQWFQYGRMKRGETPTAATPGGSIHGWGKAADVSPGVNNATVKNIFAKHGFVFDIGSESWHAHYVGGSQPTPPAPANDDQKKVQAALKAKGLYGGAVDGVFGAGSWKATQTFLHQQGLYSGAIDGVPGPNTYKAFQTYARKGGYTGAVDGVLGAASWAGFAKAITATVSAPAPAAPVVTPPAPANLAPVIPINSPVAPVTPIVSPSPEHPAATPVESVTTPPSKPVAPVVDPVIKLDSTITSKIVEDAVASNNPKGTLNNMTLFSKAFWAVALERVIKTGAYTASSLLTSQGLNVLHIDFVGIATATGLSMLTSVLVSLSSFKGI